MTMQRVLSIKRGIEGETLIKFNCERVKRCVKACQTQNCNQNSTTTYGLKVTRENVLRILRSLNEMTPDQKVRITKKLRNVTTDTTVKSEYSYLRRFARSKR